MKTKQQIPTTNAPEDNTHRLLRKPQHEPGQPPTAGVNQNPSMTYEQAMEKRNLGELTESVLTDQGWVTAIP